MCARRSAPTSPWRSQGWVAPTSKTVSPRARVWIGVDDGTAPSATLLNTTGSPSEICAAAVIRGAALVRNAVEGVPA